MEFTNQYLSYEEYKELGGTLEEMPFNILEYECQRIIDRRTFNRIQNVDKIPNEVKMCIFNMMTISTNYQKSLEIQGNIASESVDGYSVTYMSINDISNAVKEKSAELEASITDYLFGVIVNNEHILYCGVE